MTSAFVFPGQGSQFVGMARSLYESSSKAIFDIADELFMQHNPGLTKLSQVILDGPEESLKRTIYTQPAILVHSISVASILKNSGSIEAPKYVAGHSLGEFSALYMADVLNLEDVLKLVIARGALMERAPAGAMSAVVGIDQTLLQSAIAGIDGVSVANYNAPDQIVITGEANAVAKAAEEIIKAAEKVRVIPLAVGGAFHSPLMQDAANEFSKLIDATKFNTATIPVLQNIDAQPSLEPELIKTKLKKQMTGSVRWTQTVEFMLKEVSEVWELGPGKVLAGLVKKQDRRFPVTNIESASDIESVLAIKAGG